MAISFVGSGSGTVTSGGANTWLFSNLLNESGAAPTLQQNDLVVVSVDYRSPNGSASWDQTPTDPSSVAYTPAYADLYVSTSNVQDFKTSYKFMGVTPDTSVTIHAAPASGSGCFTVHVFRGVDTTTPLDVTPTTATTVNVAAHPDAPAITPVTAGAWVYVAGGITVGSSATAVTAPAELNSATNDYNNAQNNSTALGAGFYSGWTTGAFDPSAFGGQLSGSAAGTAAASVALRPASTGPGSQTINAGLTTNSQAFYAEQLNLTLYGGLTTNGQSYYGPQLNLNVNPALATNNQAFYSFTVTQPGLQTVNAPLVTNVSVTFGPDVQGYVPPDPRNMAFTVGRPLAGFHHQNPFGRFR